MMHNNSYSGNFQTQAMEDQNAGGPMGFSPMGSGSASYGAGSMGMQHNSPGSMGAQTYSCGSMGGPSYRPGFRGTASGSSDRKSVFESVPSQVDARTLQEMLAESVGRYVVCELLIGTQGMRVQMGLLTTVGQSFFILFNEDTNTQTSCDMYSLKFITFFPEGTKPDRQTMRQWWNRSRASYVPLPSVDYMCTSDGRMPSVYSSNEEMI